MLDGGVPLDWQTHPGDALRRWPVERALFLLHSARPDDPWSRYSVLAEPAEAVRHQHGRTQLSQPDSELGSGCAWVHKPLPDLRQLIRRDAGRSLWLGYLGYDLARSIESLPSPTTDDRGWPDFQLERCDGWLVHDHRSGLWTAHGTYARQGPPALDHSADDDALAFHAGALTPDQSPGDVIRSIQRAIDYIAAGDVFQVNLAQRFTASFAGSARGLYLALCEQSPAWYGVCGELTRFGDEPVRTLASISPELFLQCDAAGRVVTRPIKGTRPSSVPRSELRDSEKDRAELAMIVDLMRNDLGRVCSYGSVRVDDARAIESHPTVHHGVATISGRLHRSRDLVDLLHATLPGGSVTGAPKVRAMQIIDELEPARRGPYCGAIGMIRGGQARLNIAIRTVLVEQDTPGGTGRADAWAGGGIVADSDPQAEYQEMLDKAEAMRRALESNADRPAAIAGGAPRAQAAPRA